MSYVAASLLAGGILYLGVLIRQNHGQRIDLEKWQDLLGISAVASLVVVFYLTFTIFVVGPEANGAAILAHPFESEPDRWDLWMFYAAGFGAVAFATLSALHVVVLKVRNWSTHGHDA